MLEHDFLEFKVVFEGELVVWVFLLLLLEVEDFYNVLKVLCLFEDDVHHVLVGRCELVPVSFRKVHVGIGGSFNLGPFQGFHRHQGVFLFLHWPEVLVLPLQLRCRQLLLYVGASDFLRISL